MPSISPGDGGGGGGGGGGFSGAAGAASGTGVERNIRQIKPPSGQELRLGSQSVGSRSAPCPGCTPAADIDPCFDASCAGGNTSDPYFGGLFRFGGFHRGGGGGPGGGGEPGYGGTPAGYKPPTSNPPPGTQPPGGGGPGGTIITLPGGRGGQGSIQFGRPGSSSGVGGGRGIFGILEAWLVPFFRISADQQNVPGALAPDIGQSAALRAAPLQPTITGVLSTGNPPQAAAVLGRPRYILKRVPGSFELPLEEDQERKRRRRVYTPPPVIRSNRPR